MKNNYDVLLKVDWDILSDYVLGGLITINKHPDYDIWSLLYTHRVKETNSWDLYTRSARGLIIDLDGNILARPFQKSMEIGIINPDDIDMTQEYDIFEKYDGSLIIYFYYEPKSHWIAATKHSFISRQAQEANKMLYNKNLELDKINTYLFEIIYPENRIIINYGAKRDLILLAIINTEIGVELDYDTILKNYSKYFTMPKRYDIVNINRLSSLKLLEVENKEGFVVKFKNNYRVKIKFNSYDILHRLFKYISKKSIWNALRSNVDISDLLMEIPSELLSNAPNEFDDWIEGIVNEFNYQYMLIENKILMQFLKIVYGKNIILRKSFALKVMTNSEYRKNSSILFKLHSNRDYSELIWDMIEPENNY